MFPGILHGLLRDLLNGVLVSAGTISHRFAECWRCHTPLIFRISDDWFISVDEDREPMREANRTVEWTPAYMGSRMDDWLVNMSDWNISRRRYYGLPLPFYPCGCGHLNVIGSRAELDERLRKAGAALSQRESRLRRNRNIEHKRTVVGAVTADPDLLP